LSYLSSFTSYCLPTIVSLLFLSSLSFFFLFFFFFFFFNDTATTEIYTLSLHDALPILKLYRSTTNHWYKPFQWSFYGKSYGLPRSEEHTSELQSRFDLVCRLLLEKKKKKNKEKKKSQQQKTNKKI